MEPTCRAILILSVLAGCAVEAPIEFDQHPASAGPALAEVARMRAWLADYLPDADVVNSFTTDMGDEVSCIPIRRQLSLRGSSEPIESPPAWARTAPEHLRGANHQGFGTGYDKQGRRRWCDPGSVPLRRYQLADLEDRGTLDAFLRKGAPQMGSATHKYAFVGTPLLSPPNRGGQMINSIWRPTIAGNDGSIGQMWVSTGEPWLNNQQTVELGWQVNSNVNGHTNPVFFIYWTRDNYQTTGCYNERCAGFVHTNPNICVGCSYSFWGVPGGGITVEKYQQAVKNGDAGPWWIMQSDWVGYYPRTIFTSPMTESADHVEWGGEVQANTTNNVTTDMGNSLYGSQGGSAYMDYIGHIHLDGTYEALYWPTSESVITNAACYDLSIDGVSTLTRTKFHFGGPGKPGFGCN